MGVFAGRRGARGKDIEEGVRFSDIDTDKKIKKLSREKKWSGYFFQKKRSGDPCPWRKGRRRIHNTQGGKKSRPGRREEEAFKEKGGRYPLGKRSSIVGGDSISGGRKAGKSVVKKD